MDADAVLGDEQVKMPLASSTGRSTRPKSYGRRTPGRRRAPKSNFLRAAIPRTSPGFASQGTAEDLMDAGFEPMPEPSPPAAQWDGEHYGVTLPRTPPRR